jgi:phenylacetate-CoA ligase
VYWSHDELVDHQNRKLREIVKYAYGNVPFYHERFKQLGLKPEEIRSVEDLNKLPIVRRKELQENAERTLSKEFKVSDLAAESTSGSTGRPLHTYLTRKEDEFRKAKLLRANISCGQRPRDKWVVITAPQERSRMTRIQRRLGIYAPVPLSVFDDAHKQISAVGQIKPDVLEGYSSSLLLMTKEMEKSGAKTSSLRIIIGGAEMIDHNEKRFIEKEFDAPFYDQYSIVELEALAWQCEERNGYHIDADTIIMQFTDEDEEEVAPGERGEIICTSLFNYAMPFIRYAVGDVGVSTEANVDCLCGRTFPLMKLIEGRRDSLIVLPEDRLVSPLAFGWAMEFFKFYHCIDQYRVIQKKIDAFKFLVKMKGNSVDEEAFETELMDHIKRMLNIGDYEVRFEVEFVGDIPLDKSGKHRKVISEIKW